MAARCGENGAEKVEVETGAKSEAEGLQCLLSKTPANRSAEPKLPAQLPAQCAKDRCQIHGTCTVSFCEGDECNSSWSVDEPRVSALTKQLLQARKISQEALAQSRHQLGLNDSEATEIYVPAALTQAVEDAQSAHKEAQSRAQVAGKEAAEAKGLLDRTKAEEATLLQRQQEEKKRLPDTQDQERSLGSQLRIWEIYLEANVSAVKQKRQTFVDLRRRADAAQLGAAKALNASQRGFTALEAALKEGEARKRAEADLARRVAEAQHQVQAANGTLADNLTTLVSAWLQQQENTQAQRSSRWSERLLAAAKEVLVTMVGSLESFLENYVVSLSDKDAVMKLVQAVEKQQEAELQRLAAKKASEHALEQVRGANLTLAQAEDARKLAEQLALNASGVAAEAQEVATSAEKVQNLTRGEVQSLQQRRQSAQKSIAELQASLAAFGDKLAAAKAKVDRQSDQLRMANRHVEAAEAEMKQAVAAQRGAEAEVANAKAAFVGSSLADARKECRPTEGEFQVYLHFRELLSLAKHVVVRRLLGLQLADLFLARQQALLHDAQVAEEAQQDALLDQEAAQEEAAVSLTAAAVDHFGTEAREEAAALAALAARRNFTASQEQVDAILSTRAEADAEAAAFAAAESQAQGRLEAAQAELRRRRTELESAVNQTEKLSEDLLAALQAEAAANSSLRTCQVWQAEFNASLLLERKEELLAAAKAEQGLREADEAAAARREAWMRSSVQTHSRHLALLDAQVQLQEKEKARVEAKVAFDKAEKDVVDAQAKLDGLMKTEAETHQTITETYQALEKLKLEHADAQKEYDQQDPRDRERSFTTALDR